MANSSVAQLFMCLLFFHSSAHSEYWNQLYLLCSTWKNYATCHSKPCTWEREIQAGDWGSGCETNKCRWSLSRNILLRANILHTISTNSQRFTLVLHSIFIYRKLIAALAEVDEQACCRKGGHTWKGDEASRSARWSSRRMWPRMNLAGAASGYVWPSQGACFSGRRMGPLLTQNPHPAPSTQQAEQS
jgi:hypothetical protein